MRVKSGQTLMELLIAMTVMAVGLFAAVTIVYSNRALVQRDTDEVIVVNLAREGVELAKQLRDSNWIAGAAFDAGMTNGTDVTAVPTWNGVAALPSFDFSADNFSGPSTALIQSDNASAPGFFLNAAGDATGSATPFRRLVTFNSICFDDGLGSYSFGATCAGAQRKVGVRVVSQIRWQSQNQTKDFSIFEDLYDWR